MDLQYDKAQQATILGQYAVKIPVANDAALFFTKKDGVLYAYAYRWITDNVNDARFTGRMEVYNLQTQLRYKMTYNNGDMTYIQVAKPSDDKKISSVSSFALKTNTSPWSVFKYFGCLLIGGSWDGESCSGGFGFLVVFEDGGPGVSNEPPPPIPQSAWDNSPGFNFALYQSDGAGGTFNPSILSLMGGGVFWVKPPTFPGDDNNGCAVVNESIKTTNDKGTQTVKTQTTGGCPQWTPYYFDFDNALTEDDLENAVPLDDGKPHIDVQKYINCFNDGNSGTYKLTLYIDQPKPGTNSHYLLDLATYTTPHGVLWASTSNMKFDVGHAFIGFEKHEDNGTVINQTLGFYPANGKPIGNGEVKDDGGHSYNISYTITVTQAEFNAALNSAVSDDANKEYVLTAYNCSDAALDWMNATGASIPSISRGNFNNTPGDLGQAIKQRTGAQNWQSMQNALASHGPCN